MQWGIRDEAVDRRFIERRFIAERSHKSRVPTGGNSKMEKLMEDTVRNVLTILRLKSSQSI